MQRNAPSEKLHLHPEAGEPLSASREAMDLDEGDPGHIQGCGHARYMKGSWPTGRFLRGTWMSNLHPQGW